MNKSLEQKLRVGTDCSGIEAPIQALRQLGIPFTHVFSSDIDRFCIQSIKANYNPDIIFGDKEGPFPNGDITERKIDDVPDIDLYVCGFPCQSFSSAGKRKGFKDKRGNVFWSCLEVIKKKKPKYFILENVKGLLSHDKSKYSNRGEHGKTWTTIWSALNKLKEYTVKWKVLNTRDYGIPQNRERVYIVGVKSGNFEWPEKLKMKSLKDFVDWEDKSFSKPRETWVKKISSLDNPIFINIGFIKNSYKTANKICPTLTTGSSQLWCVPLSRYANVKEFCLLQGFKKIVFPCSVTQTRKQLGNSMSVNVVKAILEKL